MKFTFYDQIEKGKFKYYQTDSNNVKTGYNLIIDISGENMCILIYKNDNNNNFLACKINYLSIHNVLKWANETIEAIKNAAIWISIHKKIHSLDSNIS